MNDLDLVSNPQLRNEFQRAINIAGQTQLTIFREGSDLLQANVIADFAARWRAWLDGDRQRPRQTPDHSHATLDDSQATLIRKVLVDTMDSFNDPFANYIQPDALRHYYQRRGGHFVGIGVKYRARAEAYPVIIGPLVGGPLEEADVRPGDLVRSIDGIDQFAASSREITASLRGEPGSSVLLQLSRSTGAQDILVQAVRQKVSLQYARAEMLDGGLGYLRVSRFGGKTHMLVKRLVEGFVADAAVGIILDLRDNSGGSTLAARSIVSLFSPDSHIYAEQFKSGKTRRLPRHGNTVTDLPLVILVNQKSMSSSEIVAGALQASGRATLVGSPTYGKGLIQRVFDLKAPLGGAIRATIASYATLDDVLIHGRGVVPDRYIASASRNLFSETGSLNITPAARQFKRQLLEADILKRYPAQRAAGLINETDLQLSAAISVIKG